MACLSVYCETSVVGPFIGDTGSLTGRSHTLCWVPGIQSWTRAHGSLEKTDLLTTCYSQLWHMLNRDIYPVQWKSRQKSLRFTCGSPEAVTVEMGLKDGGDLPRRRGWKGRVGWKVGKCKRHRGMKSGVFSGENSSRSRHVSLWCVDQHNGTTVPETAVDKTGDRPSAKALESKS